MVYQKYIPVGLLFLLSCCYAYGSPDLKKNTSIIYLIGDGMGPAYTSAYRYYRDDPRTKIVERTIFDEMLVGMASTYPDDAQFTITDSAAAATALATGTKTYNGAIGVDVNHKRLTSILEQAKNQGYQTAIAVTSQINHATPAAFASHVDSRASYNLIADQMFDQRINGKLKVDLLLGGGTDYFMRTDRNLIAEFKQAGYQYVSSFAQLDELTKLPALGLFAPAGLEAAIDSEEPLRLTKMTAKALSLLGDKPFFLLLEASQIDWCGHKNDIACVLAEMHDMAETMKLIKQYISVHPNTLFVATADHSTGGLSVGARDQEVWAAASLKQITASAANITAALMSHPKEWQTHWQTLTGIILTAQEIEKMNALLQKKIRLKQSAAQINAQVLAFINDHSNTGWTSMGHTGEDVQVFSYGKGSEAFVGAMDNTAIPRKLFTYLPR